MTRSSQYAKSAYAQLVIPDGDVAASLLTCMPDSEVDVLYGIGGAPEGVVSAAVIRALDGDMQGRSLARHDVKGDSEEKPPHWRTGTGALQSNGH